MRLKSLILWDMKFQVKYGFYLLYGILTLLYLLVLSAIPETWRENIAAILIFSDPAAMGLFFMGAIVLLEKSQKIPCAFAVSPVNAGEYIAGKVISLCVIALVVAAVLALAAGAGCLPYTLFDLHVAWDDHSNKDYEPESIHFMDRTNRDSGICTRNLTFIQHNPCCITLLSHQYMHGYGSRPKSYSSAAIPYSPAAGRPVNPRP